MPGSDIALRLYLAWWGAWRSRELTRKIGYPSRSPEQALAVPANAADYNEDAICEEIDAAVAALERHGMGIERIILLRAFVHHKHVPSSALRRSIKHLAMMIEARAPKVGAPQIQAPLPLAA